MHLMKSIAVAILIASFAVSVGAKADQKPAGKADDKTVPKPDQKITGKADDKSTKKPEENLNVKPQEKLLPKADGKPISRIEIDKRIAVTTHDTIQFGTYLFNKGYQEECLRLYQGYLHGIEPLLDHHPELAEMIRKSLLAAAEADLKQAAHFLRPTLDSVQKVTSAALALKEPESNGLEKKPLWYRLGGEKAVTAVVHDFIAASLKDPKVNLTRKGKYPLDAKAIEKFERKLVEMISAGTGGPLLYEGKGMQKAHTDMAITEDEYNAMSAILLTTLKSYKVPQPEIDELLALVKAVMPSIVGQ